MNPLKTFSLTFMLAALLVGCASSTAPVAVATEQVNEPAVEGPTDAPPTDHPAPAPFTVVDALGREVTFEELPQRITIAGRATSLIAHSVYMFPEAVERIVAVEDRAQRDLSFYRVVDPNFDEKPLLERNAGPEQIVPMDPDVVFMKSYLAESLGEPIEQLGIPVVYFDLETPEQFERDIDVIGEVLGNPERAVQINAFYAERRAAIAELISPLEEAERPRVLLMQYSDRGGDIAFNVPALGWLQTSLINDAGGIPVWLDASEGGGWTIVGFEQIAAWDPEVVIAIYYPDDASAVVDSLYADANWQALSSTQNGSIYGFPGDFLSWDQPDPRWILGLTWLVKTLHPEAAASIDLQADVARFYSEMYGLDPATVEAEILPRLSSTFE